MAEKILWKDRKRYLGLPISFTKYSLTETRFFVEIGLFNLKEEEILLYRIRDISLSRSFGQRLFGVGTITLHSSDKTSNTQVIKNVKKPREVKEMIFENVESSKKNRQMKTTELIGDDFDDNDLD